MEAITERLDPAELEARTIAHGAHNDRSNGLCSMELVAWLAGEPHSDSPACTCPIIASFAAARAAARAAAPDAALDAALAAARDAENQSYSGRYWAARRAADKVFAETTLPAIASIRERLQLSALELVERMIALR